MYPTYVTVTAVTIAMLVAIVVADLTRAQFVLGNSAEVGVPESWLPMLAALKAAGSIGLLLGLVGVWQLGVAAAIGLVLFFSCAVGVHIRARVFYNIAFPGAYLAFSAASLVLLLVDR
jgi:hypothetical protein